MRLIVVNKTLDRAFDNLLILLRNTIFALQRIGRWCGFFTRVNYSFLFIPKFLLGRDFFSHEPLWHGQVFYDVYELRKKLDGLKSVRWCGLISSNSPKGRVNSAHKISGCLFFSYLGSPFFEPLCLEWHWPWCFKARVVGELLCISVYYFSFSSGTGSFFRLCDIRRADRKSVV